MLFRKLLIKTFGANLLSLSSECKWHQNRTSNYVILTCELKNRLLLYFLSSITVHIQAIDNYFTNANRKVNQY